MTGDQNPYPVNHVHPVKKSPHAKPRRRCDLKSLSLVAMLFAVRHKHGNQATEIRQI